MKLQYFLITSSEQDYGIFKKVLYQTSSLRLLGADINLVLVNVGDCSHDHLDFINVKKLEQCLNWDIFSRFIRSRQIANIIKDEIIKLRKEDCLYLRYPYPMFYYPYNIIRKFRKGKIIFEHNTEEREESKLISGTFSQSYLQELIIGNFIRAQSDAIVGVTDEITQYEMSKAGTLNKPHITIGNGFDVNSVEIRKPPLKFNAELHFLCVANVSRWHGLDRIIKGLVDTNSSIQVILHIAGNGSDINSLKQFVEKLNLENHVIFHGFTTGAALDNLFNNCHIAVGSLGIHRKGLTQTSELKVREYCARGIPWIIGCKDPDFPDDFPYIHRIPADESPVNIEEVIEFAKKVYADLDHPQKMRAYAVEHLDWSVKMKKLKAFLESLVDESASTP